MRNIKHLKGTVILLGFLLSCGQNVNNSGGSKKDTINANDRSILIDGTSDTKSDINNNELHDTNYQIDINQNCKTGEKRCTKTEELLVCNENHRWDITDCLAKGLVCSNGKCTKCHPGEKSCKNNAAAVCKDDGSGWDTTPCGDKICVNGACMKCVPDSLTCKGEKVVKCSSDGSSEEVIKDCDPVHTGNHCWQGKCVSPCKQSGKFGTNVGCIYWAVDLDQKGKNPYNHEDSAQNSPFAVVIGNTSTTITATVRIYKEGNVVKTVQVPPSQSKPIYLPPYNITGTMLGKRAWRIESDLPVVAYQFNPLENVDVYSNDASMLIPQGSLGSEYIVVNYPQSWENLSTYVTIIGVSKDPTHVTITPAADIKAGNGVMPLEANKTYKFTLNYGDVLNLETNKVGADLTGTTIKADKEIAVFAGAACANVPFSECVNGKCTFQTDMSCGYNGCELIGYCDHLEQQLMPIESLGKTYVISKTYQRGKAGDIVRIMASEDNTQITITPDNIKVPVLNKGDKFDFEIMHDVIISANRPIEVAQFLEGSEAPDPDEQCVGNLEMGGTYPCSNIVVGDCFCEHSKKYCKKDSDCDTDDAKIGDPTFILSIPTRGYKTKYTFLVPGKYTNNYLNIIAPSDTTIKLDDNTIDPSKFRKVGDFIVAVLEIKEGSHIISGNKPFGIIVYGWDEDVSYGYPGGGKIIYR